MNTTVLTGSHVMQAFLISSAYVLWPIIGKYSQVSGTWVTSLILFFTAVGGGLCALPGMRSEELPSAKGIAILAAAGLINGIAAYFYSMKTTDQSVPTGNFIVAVVVGMLVMGTIFSYFLNGEPITVRKVLGLGAAVLAAYLFTGK